MDDGGEPLSVREFARRRGCSYETIRLAIKAGRLVKAVVNVNGKPKIADYEMAMQELDATTDLTRAPHAVVVRASERRRKERGDDDEGASTSGLFDLAEEAAREKHWKANLAELDYRVKAGELVPVEEVEAKFVDAVTAAKTKLLGLPKRIQQRMPHISVEDVRVIHELVREALEDLAYGR